MPNWKNYEWGSVGITVRAFQLLQNHGNPQTFREPELSKAVSVRAQEYRKSSPYKGLITKMGMITKEYYTERL